MTKFSMRPRKKLRYMPITAGQIYLTQSAASPTRTPLRSVDEKFSTRPRNKTPLYAYNGGSDLSDPERGIAKKNITSLVKKLLFVQWSVSFQRKR